MGSRPRGSGSRAHARPREHATHRGEHDADGWSPRSSIPRRCTPSTPPSGPGGSVADRGANVDMPTTSGSGTTSPTRSPSTPRATRSPTTSTSWWWAPASPGCSRASSCARPASSASGSSTRPAASAAPGTGTATPASCATSSRTSTCPMLEEMGTIPTMKYASGEEIRLHLDAIADKYRLGDGALFHTDVESSVVGRGVGPLDDPHRPRRRDPREVRGDVRGHPQPPEAARAPGHRHASGAPPSTPPAGTTRTPAAAPPTRTSPTSPTRSSPSSAPAARASSASRPSGDRRSTSTCSSAPRRPSAGGATTRPTPSAWRAWSRAGNGERMRELLGRDDRQADRDRPRRRRLGRVRGPGRELPGEPGMSPDELALAAEAFDYEVMEEHRRRVDARWTTPTSPRRSSRTTATCASGPCSTTSTSPRSTCRRSRWSTARRASTR